MIDRSVVEHLLTANGVDPSAPDEEIKSLLISAKWHASDVETALMVLRENSSTHKRRVDSLHKVMRSDENLDPQTISALLGIDVDIKQTNVPTGKTYNQMTVKQMTVVALVALTLALTFVITAMWYMEMGIFHIASGFFGN
tara:strand:+ start:997 stop:1419 length:423 start_codon:yes stop_codon:yes gene_type:complete